MAAPTITSTPFSAASYYGGGPITQSYTHVSGDDLFVYYGTSYSPGGIPSGVTWNGTALTNIASLTQASVSNRGSLWRLAAASGATQNVVVTLPGSSDDIGTLVIFSANGVTGLGTAVTASYAGINNPSITLTGDSNALMLAAFTVRRDPATALATVTATSNGTDLANTGYSTASNLGDRTVLFTKAGSASVAMTGSIATSPNYGVMLGIPLTGSGGGGSFHAQLTGTRPLHSLVNGGLAR